MNLNIPPHIMEELLRQGKADLSGETLVVKDGEGNEVIIKIEEGTLDVS